MKVNKLDWEKIYFALIIFVMGYPVQVGRAFIIPYSHVAATRTEGETVDLPEAESAREVLEDRLGLQVKDLDGGVLADTWHGEHLPARIEAEVVDLRGEVEDGLLWLGTDGGHEGVYVVDVDHTRGGAGGEVRGADIKSCPHQTPVILKLEKAVVVPETSEM